MDLCTEYLGLPLRTPLVASPSPLTADLAALRKLEDAGVAAVVLPSLFEEEIESEPLELDDLLERWRMSFGEAPNSIAELPERHTRPEQYLELVAAAKRALDVPVFASLNVSAPGAWIEQARRIEEAGADGLELTFFTVAADPAVSAADVESRYREVVAAVRAAVRIPVAVKLTPFFTALAHTVRGLLDAGADGLVLFHRGYQPYLDLENLEVSPRMMLSTSQHVLLALRWIAILRDQVSVSLAAAGGVHTARDAMRLLLAGADVVMTSSALVEHGPGLLPTIEQGMVEWMTKHEHDSVRRLVGSASRRSVADPSAFERIHYVRTLRTFFGSLAS